MVPPNDVGNRGFRFLGIPPHSYEGSNRSSQREAGITKGKILLKAIVGAERELKKIPTKPRTTRLRSGQNSGVFVRLQ